MKRREKEGKERSTVCVGQLPCQQARSKEGRNVLDFMKYSGNVLPIQLKLPAIQETH